MYGLESVQLLLASIRAFDTFQKKGLRKVLGLLKTYGQVEQGDPRTNTDDVLYRQANYHYRDNSPQSKKLQELSVDHKH